ncbi:MAG: hypothetical protein LAO51_06725, partial [Acidobacteriia bacterium]|nr:hypothetical protein [Terriglobia bacterium]
MPQTNGPSGSRARPPGAPLPGTRGWAAVCLLTLAFAALAYGCVLWWPRTVDDAFIVFRYAKNLADGAGPTFNPGERVEGYSCPAWMLLLAGAVGAGFDPVAASKALGCASAALLLLALYRSLLGAGALDWGAATAAILLGSSFVLQLWTVAGLETVAYALLLFAGLAGLSRAAPSRRQLAWTSLALVAAALTRPEGLAFWALGFLSVALSREEGRWRALSAYALPGGLLIAHFAWRLAYYGAPFPNTYDVKTGGGIRMWVQGLHGLSLFVRNPAHLGWILCAAMGAVVGIADRASRRAAVVMGGAVVAQLLYVVAVGDDSLRVHRFYVPVLAPMAFLVGLLFVRNGTERGRALALRGLGALAVTLTASVSVRAMRQELVPALHEGMLVYQEGNVRLGRYLARTQDPGTWIAVASAGAIPYYSGLPAIDMYGLNDRHIARTPFPERTTGVLMKWDNAYVLSRRPRLIVPNRGYFEAGNRTGDLVAQRPEILASAPMDRDLLERLRADGGYGLRPIRFEDGSVFWVYELKGR